MDEASPVRLVALGLATLTLAACGGEGSNGEADEAAVKAVLATYVEAVIAADADAACSLLTDKLKRKLYDEFGTTTCEPVVEAAAPGIDNVQRENLRERIAADNLNAKIFWNTATVTSTPNVQDPINGSVQLVKVDGEWYIDQLR